MFHVLLMFFPLIGLLALVIIGSLLLFGVTSIIVGAVGGSVAAKHINNRLHRRLIFIGLLILLLVGSLCILPAAAVFARLPLTVIAISGDVLLAIIGGLAIAGIAASRSVERKTLKTVLTVIFGIVCAVAVPLAVYIFSTAVA